jgi:hypothetical protein
MIELSVNIRLVRRCEDGVTSFEVAHTPIVGVKRSKKTTRKSRTACIRVKIRKRDVENKKWL